MKGDSTLRQNLLVKNEENGRRKQTQTQTGTN